MDLFSPNMPSKIVNFFSGLGLLQSCKAQMLRGSMVLAGLFGMLVGLLFRHVEAILFSGNHLKDFDSFLFTSLHHGFHYY